MKGAGPVDRGGAAHTAALQDGDALVLGLAPGVFLVQRGVGFGLFLFEVGTRFELPLLDDDDVQACFGQQLRGDAGASARADDGHIAGDAFRQGAVFAAENFPAALQARRNGVNDVGHAISVDAG